MTRLYILLKDRKQWGGLYPSEDLLTARQYLKLHPTKEGDKVQVLNLTGSYRYLGEGYYCSLLAEARGHRVIPSVATLNDLASRGLYGPELKTVKAPVETESNFRVFFGRTLDPQFAELGLQLFDRFPAPILEASIKEGVITKLKPKGLKDLSDAEETLFAEALDAFSAKIWRVKKPKRKYRFDLAMLVDPQEKFPPSDTGALKRFIRAGRTLGVQVDLITHKQAARLAEYDGLFIRETTSIHGQSFQMARRAENLGLAVIDTPEAILRCTNKIYLAERLEQAKVAIPKTRVVQHGDEEALVAAAQELGFPLVMKIPDGSFSRGVVKAKDMEEVHHHAQAFFKQSALILLQEYCYTEYDWRVGVLNRQPLFVSKYFMSRGHWQIYNHSGKKTQSGGFETLPVAAAPKKVVETAVKAANLMGDSLFGVDLKVVDGKPVVIEVNDNPNIDSGVEDKVLGDQIYLTIIQEFIKRMS
ncbi:RimK family protein [Gallaecimonas kandeliae]|uniref:RimK family protein n=1 Tax=Gallaecimonas kandeliae TaxID=3029055 RepID=UPI002648FC08|nr:RimK family protein [Gallaecimonas kandeliae]WKE66924.1 RimK family protein [Gallaecimonas kandeliae]